MKVFEGILLVSPEPPIPSSTFILFSLIPNFFFAFSISDFSINIFGSLSISSFKLLFIKFFAVKMICWFFFSE